MVDENFRAHSKNLHAGSHLDLGGGNPWHMYARVVGAGQALAAFCPAQAASGDVFGHRRCDSHLVKVDQPANIPAVMDESEGSLDDYQVYHHGGADQRDERRQRSRW